MIKLYTVIFTTFLGVCTIHSNGQSKKKVCQPISVSFKNFQKKRINIITGLGATRSNIDNHNYWSFNGQVGINYFPINYLEVGFRVKPTMANIKTAGTKTLVENNLYVRYYPLFFPCYKMAFLTGAGVFRDGSAYSVKGEPISTNKLFSSINAGLVIVPKPSVQFETNTEIFFNRTVRYNFGLFWNFNVH